MLWPSSEYIKQTELKLVSVCLMYSDEGHIMHAVKTSVMILILL